MFFCFGVGVFLDLDLSIFCLGGVLGGFVGEELGLLLLGVLCLSFIGGDDLWWFCIIGEGDFVVCIEGVECFGFGDLLWEVDVVGLFFLLIGVLCILFFCFFRKCVSEVFFVWGNLIVYYEVNCNLLV